MKTIVTTFVYPPIPVRHSDWRAHYEGEEDEQMDLGWGESEEAARRDLIENHPRCREEYGIIGHSGECLLCDAESGVACRK